MQRMSGRTERRHTILGALIITLGLTAGAAWGLHQWLTALDWLQAWLLAVTVVTFVTYGYDKMIAGSGATRVPERVLLMLAFAGGTLGAMAGMKLFHHKTSKESFLERFWLVVALQIVLIAGWYLWRRVH